MPVRIPAALLPCVREGTLALARDVAEAIDHDDDLRECTDRLRAIYGLLDAIDGSAEGGSAALAMGDHVQTVAQAVAIMLPLMTTAVSDLKDADPARLASATDELRLMRELAARVRHAGSASSTTNGPRARRSFAVWVQVSARSPRRNAS
ncbi:MAG TPA: hypothetical protein VK721_09875 [Solirubrobacteraceae bacterium]|jgi:hypothetical protein|nr:hypothetical protein [Solirubrobacteraceae bacterium]